MAGALQTGQGEGGQAQMQAGLHTVGGPVGLAGKQGEVDQGGAAVPGSAGAGSSGSRTWRTREQYQADLVASSTPFGVPQQVMQAARSRSELATLAGQHIRRQAGLDFVQTPTATDATNR